MKTALTLLAVLALMGSTAYASVPDPDYCSVTPMDDMDVARLIGVPDEMGVPSAQLNIFVAAFGGDAIDNAYVEVVLSGLCDGLCICDAAVLTGYTVAGWLTIEGQFGGCCDLAPDAAVVVVAEGVGIRSAGYVVSPDYDGATGDCAVTLADFIYFGSNWGQVSGVTCADYSGDEACTLADFITFGAGWGKFCAPM